MNQDDEHKRIEEELVRAQECELETVADITALDGSINAMKNTLANLEELRDSAKIRQTRQANRVLRLLALLNA